MPGELPSRSRRRFLFAVAGGLGHLHPMMPLARALKDRGHEVGFAAGASMRPACGGCRLRLLAPGWQTGRSARVPAV